MQPVKQPFEDQRGKHRARDEWGPREIIALTVIVGAFALAIIALITDHAGATVPAWTVALIGGIGWYYFKNGKGGNHE